ncbi:MAG: hypothetical protein A2V66_12150 [Ignavibacteria bacterium RBG_13_36_8]|nr:MAG: hypothetical protein A2V66_12150 [Ignavibacteria bacterium RBG_13_36_8]
MFNSSSELFTKVIPVTWYGKTIQFPITRIFIVLLFLAPVTILANLIGLEFVRSFSEPYSSLLRYSRGLVFLILFILMYGLYTRYIERREPLELSFTKFYKELGFGVSIAFGLVGIMVLFMYVLGFYKIGSFGSLNNMSASFVTQMMVGFTEELIFRLILFKLVEEFAGSWIALIVQALIFGFAHITNPNASVWTSTGLVISDLFLFGGAFMLTRRIWLIMGIHWGWNFFQAGVFGMPNSGIDRPSWIEPIITGPEWITGGAWGIEASYIAIALCLLIGICIFKKAIDNNQLVLPVWRRNKLSEV